MRVAQKSFTAETSAGERSFQEGALLIPLGVQAAKLEEIREILTLAVLEHDVDVSVVFGGLTPDGVDLGSSSFAKLTKPKVLMVVGTNTDDYESGEVWHLFDRRLQLPITMVDSHLLASTNLSSYTTIVLVSGTYSNVSAAGIERLQQWLKQGGNLIALGTAGRWLNSAKIVTLKSRVQEEDEKSPVTRMPYAVADEQAAMKSIEGTIFEVQIDRTHPLGFGFQSETLPVFRDHTYILEPSSNAYSTPAVYSNAPLLSGYASQENQLLLSGSAAVVVKSEGAGRVIAIPNNPLFRSFWRGSERFFLNSLFFGPVVREP